MDRDGFRDVLEVMAAATNAGDADAVAALFAEDVRYSDPTRYSFTRRDELIPFFEPPEGGHSVVWHRIVFDEVEQTGVAEYTYDGHHRYHGAVVVRIEGDIITGWREWQHISELDWDEFVGRP